MSKQVADVNDNDNHKITAGDKCAFGAMIRAKRSNGWTPATKILAEMYYDLSEKEGYAYALQDDLEFMTGLSSRTMSRSNETISKSGLFTIKHQSDGPVLAYPDHDVIAAHREAHRLAWEKRREDKLRRKTDQTKCLDPSDKLAGPSDKMAGGSRQNGGHNHSSNLSIQSLDSNLSFRNSSNSDCERSIQDNAPTAQTGDEIETINVTRLSKPRTSVRQAKINQPVKSKYRQSKEEADNCFSTLSMLQWRQAGDSDDSQFDPKPEADKAARIHWHRLLKEGIAAERLVRGANKFIKLISANQLPSLAGWLGKWAEVCLDEESELFVPEHDEPEHDNDNREFKIAAGDRSTFGGYCNPGDPF